jgi:hypothetical protein
MDTATIFSLAPASFVSQPLGWAVLIKRRSTYSPRRELAAAGRAGSTPGKSENLARAVVLEAKALAAQSFQMRRSATQYQSDLVELGRARQASLAAGRVARLLSPGRAGRQFPLLLAVEVVALCTTGSGMGALAAAAVAVAENIRAQMARWVVVLLFLARALLAAMVAPTGQAAVVEFAPTATPRAFPATQAGVEAVGRLIRQMPRVMAWAGVVRARTLVDLGTTRLEMAGFRLAAVVRRLQLPERAAVAVAAVPVVHLMAARTAKPAKMASSFFLINCEAGDGFKLENHRIESRI